MFTNSDMFTDMFTADYIAIDKMSYMSLLKLKNFTFLGYSAKILKFRFSFDGLKKTAWYEPHGCNCF